LASASGKEKAEGSRETQGKTSSTPSEAIQIQTPDAAAPTNEIQSHESGQIRSLLTLGGLKAEKKQTKAPTSLTQLAKKLDSSSQMVTKSTPVSTNTLSDIKMASRHIVESTVVQQTAQMKAASTVESVTRKREATERLSVTEPSATKMQATEESRKMGVLHEQGPEKSNSTGLKLSQPINTKTSDVLDMDGDSVADSSESGLNGSQLRSSTSHSHSNALKTTPRSRPEDHDVTGLILTNTTVLLP